MRQYRGFKMSLKSVLKPPSKAKRVFLSLGISPLDVQVGEVLGLLLLLQDTLFMKIMWSVSTSYRPQFSIFLKNFLSIMKYTYLRSGNFDFHRRKSFPISKVKTAIWRYFQKHGVSLHVLPSTIINIFEKNLQYDKIYVSIIWWLYFSPT